MNGKLCAAIVSSNPESMIQSAREVLSLGADLVEFRLDHLDKINGSLPSMLREFSDKCIITIREKNQGGAFKGSEQERLALLRSFSLIHPLYIDIELDAAEQNPEVVRELSKGAQNVIVSYHDFSSTPDLDMLISIYNRQSAIGGISKLITTAKSAQDNINILSLYKKVKPNGKLISFAMGDLGVLTRILCLYAGSPVSYVSFGKRASAPGQIPLEVMKNLIADPQ